VSARLRTRLGHDFDLRNANLTNANFRGSDLTGSNFTNANFTNVDFRGSRITRADVKDIAADITGAIFDPRVRAAHPNGNCIS